MTSTGKLQVLILDDLVKLNASPVALFDLKDWFDFVLAESPEHVFVAPSTREMEGAITRRADAPVGEAPFDIYLADMRLCLEEKCTDPHHLEIGLHTQGAGFLACLMWAIRSPRFPQVIFPYSASTEQFKGTLQLCRAIKPRAIYFVNEQHIEGKGDYSFGLFLSRAMPYLRENIILSHGVDCYLPMAERNRLEAKLAAADGEVNASDAVNIRYGFINRSIMLGALFFDKLDQEADAVPVEAVAEFLSRLPLVDPVELQARDLASAYHAKALTEQSRNLHALARIANQPLDAETLRKIESAKTPPIWKKYAKPKDDEEINSIRLAIIFGLILLLKDDPIQHLLSEVGGEGAEDPMGAHVTTYAAFTDESLNEQLRDVSLNTDSLRAVIGPIVGALEQSGRKSAAALLKENLEEICKASNSVEQLVFELDDTLVNHFVRFLEPFPGRPPGPPNLNAGGRWAKGISDIGFDAAQMRKLTPEPITPYERAAALRFLSDIMPTGGPVPRWL